MARTTKGNVGTAFATGKLDDCITACYTEDDLKRGPDDNPTYPLGPLKDGEYGLSQAKSIGPKGWPEVKGEPIDADLHRLHRGQYY